MWKIEKIIKKGEYLYAKVLGHPNATKHGYVLEHRIVMENHLVRLLNKSEIVHHKDGNKKNNKIKNLEVMSHSSHCKYHGNKTLANLVDFKCPACKKVFTQRRTNSRLVKGGIFSSCSPKCRGVFSRMMQLNGRTHEVDLAISENILCEYKGKRRANR